MGFIAAAGVLVSAYGAKKQGDAASAANKTQKKLTREQMQQEKEESERKFYRDLYLQEQQRKFQQQDKRYREDAIGGFRGLAPASVQKMGLTPPTPTSTEGLADFDPNQLGLAQKDKLRFGGTGVTEPPKTMTGMAPFRGGNADGYMDR